MKVLFIGAHPDDIELGAGGSLIKHLKKKDEIIYIIFSKGEKGGDPTQREREVKEVLEYLNIKEFYIYSFPDTKMHDYFIQIKDTLEEVIKKYEPYRIYTHSLNDPHQDHSTVARATRIAGRKVPQILSFWSPSTYNNFHPEYFIDISEIIIEKLKVLQKFKSQNNKDFLKRSLVKSINRYFGYLSGVKYAEGFEIIRFRELE